MINTFENADNISISINNSSLISNITWNRKEKTNKGDLYITFKEGAKYKYIEVPSTIVQDMLVSESVGAFFCKNIKDQYLTHKETING